ncbi:MULTISPECIES: type II toxin-antitoxin system RatA family toxin [Pseudomonas]|jgi:ribosome-associated toxin RatA of RatAB toxin-antitoxin module|uniref:Type II toxin-antitoxin system RatA family toxin n=1 Tax=Pseudomonas poae TaxID=200451 RepID=A0A7M1KG23_9PSED|nr:MULTISPECIES: type II toxin-antitoxin system RatA family toxin [Pseudomonas]NWA85062.1 type II toxin-antitoxin system RatA family toxin [Pseudomonas sp. D2002]QHD09115.1 ubiquinone-binding protein [Pseudomonas sp. R76]QOQ75286.1 type II toxin-antitoxin system RatA family toxin [Pseudomonas poae]
MTTHIQRSALLPYPAQALYDLVNDVARYPEFLPWCSAAEVLESSDEHMVASVGVAKAGMSQHFVTRNILVPGQSIEMNLQEGPFTQLHGVWVFKALTDKACKISLDLSFDYAGPIVRATLGPLFNQAANTLVDAFCQRAKQLHG